MTSIRIRALLCITMVLAVGFAVAAQKPELVIQTGHSQTGSSNALEAILFNPDGKILATGSQDGTVNLWDAGTGLELRTIKTGWINTIAFSPNGKILACGGPEGLKLWDVVSGTVVRTIIPDHESNVYAVTFSPDGNIVASGSHTGRSKPTLKLWNVTSGMELQDFKGFSSTVTSLSFNPNGKTIASSGGDNSVKLWDVSTGTELRALRAHSNPVSSVVFSPDGKTLASGSKGDETIKLWDVATGSELRTLELKWFNRVAFAFSPDGKTLATGGSGKVKLWDVATGTDLRTVEAQRVNAIAFSPDGHTLASSNGSNTTLWNISTGTELRTLLAHSAEVKMVAFLPESDILVTSTADDAVALIPISVTEVRALKGSHHFNESIAFSANGKTLASESLDGTLNLWDLSTLAQLRTLATRREVANATGAPQRALRASVAFSPDGKTVASLQNSSTVKLWDMTTGAEVRNFKGNFSKVGAIAFSPNGKIIASETSEGVKLWDVATRSELRTLGGDCVFGAGATLAFSPDGKTLADNDTLWDVHSGRAHNIEGHLQLTAKGTLIHHPIRSVAFSPDGKTLATGAGDTVKLWNVASGREVANYESSQVNSVAFSANGKILLSGGRDGRINFWDVRNASNLASLIVLDEEDWMVATPDGLFDGSPAAWNKIIWRFNNNTFDYAPVESFFSDFYYPGLLSDIFAGKHPQAPSDISQKDRRQALVKLTLADAQPNSTVTTRNSGVKIDVSQAPAGAQDVRLFRNGSLVKLWRGNVLQGKNSVMLEASIPIVAGENRLTAYAFNHDNIKSSDATLTVTGANSLKHQGVGYVLAVGVNEYADTQYNLKYAVADAQDFAGELKRQQARLANYERVEVISLNDRDATKVNILKALADLSAKVQPEDALVIFFAGHGTAQQSRFYLIPHDLGYTGSRTQLDSAGLQSILTHSISDEEIERAVEGIDAGQMLLVIDACNSGQALEAEEKRRGPMNSKGLAQLAYEKGMYILTVAQSYQAANEAERYGHGFLTYALVEEGLKTGAADKEPKDGQVLLREWLDFATERVPQMQQDKLDEQKKQGRQLDRIKFAEADSGSERSIQRPRVFYRRETETHPLVVARP